jgi:hypothetical protein
MISAYNVVLYSTIDIPNELLDELKIESVLRSDNVDVNSDTVQFLATTMAKRRAIAVMHGSIYINVNAIVSKEQLYAELCNTYLSFSNLITRPDEQIRVAAIAPALGRFIGDNEEMISELIRRVVDKRQELGLPTIGFGS